LWLIGEGPERAELERRATELPGLAIIPYQSEPDVLAECLASADIYVAAGPHETFGLSIIEAQAAGLPVVGVRSGALIERVVEGTGLLSAPGDVEAFADSIRRVVPERRTMGAAARRHVLDSGFGWDQTFARWQDAWEKAAARLRVES
jgi:alpha-1,6-mannosyltransferase